jgi:hypothetical protein
MATETSLSAAAPAAPTAEEENSEHMLQTGWSFWYDKKAAKRGDAA